jgi:RNA recognition motif-containing protein
MNIGYILTEEQLQRYFSQYGSVLDVYLPRQVLAFRMLDIIACALLFLL